MQVSILYVLLAGIISLQADSRSKTHISKLASVDNF